MEIDYEKEMEKVLENTINFIISEMPDNIKTGDDGFEKFDKLIKNIAINICGNIYVQTLKDNIPWAIQIDKTIKYLEDMILDLMDWSKRHIN
jgi:hypothetical protein